MRAEIYRQLKGLGFTHSEAEEMSLEFTRMFKSAGVAGARAVKAIGKDLAVCLLHSWVLALLI